MGIIRIEDMEFYAFHGHFREEQIIGNKFTVTLTIETDLSKAGNSDNLQDTVNYQEVYAVVKKEMEEKSHLLEHIATRILNSLFSGFSGITKATVKVSKLNPVMGGHIGSVSVELTHQA
jgi:7,8-dihydroneopterin aldolase/epimerase/oxygenase